MQFDVHWLAGMTTDASSMKTTSRLNSHTASITKIGEADYRVVVFSMTNAIIAGNSGDVLSLVFKGLSREEYNNTVIKIDNIILSNKSSLNKASSLELSFSIGAGVGVDVGIQTQKMIVYTHNQTLYVEGIKDDYYVLDMTGNVVYYGQSSVVPLPYGVYMIVADGERHKVMIR
jgi:hypothetical protein